LERAVQEFKATLKKKKVPNGWVDGLVAGFAGEKKLLWLVIYRDLAANTPENR
jgi:hypothetical protein